MALRKCSLFTQVSNSKWKQKLEHKHSTRNNNSTVNLSATDYNLWRGCFLLTLENMTNAVKVALFILEQSLSPVFSCNLIFTSQIQSWSRKKIKQYTCVQVWFCLKKRVILILMQVFFSEAVSPAWCTAVRQSGADIKYQHNSAYLLRRK